VLERDRRRGACSRLSASLLKRGGRNASLSRGRSYSLVRLVATTIPGVVLRRRCAEEGNKVMDRPGCARAFAAAGARVRVYGRSRVLSPWRRSSSELTRVRIFCGRGRDVTNMRVSPAIEHNSWQAIGWYDRFELGRFTPSRWQSPLAATRSHEDRERAAPGEDAGSPKIAGAGGEALGRLEQNTKHAVSNGERRACAEGSSRERHANARFCP
jgi:hypothetical protein